MQIRFNPSLWSSRLFGPFLASLSTDIGESINALN